MTDQQLEILNKAYLVGDYDLKRYRELREAHINAVTGYDDTAAPEIAEFERTENILADTIDIKPPPTDFTEPTLKITETKTPPAVASSVSADKSHRGPSFLQFLWVSIAILLFIYMYTATID